MQNRGTFIAAIIIGAFVLSCAQHMMNGNNDGGDSIPDAMAETPTCCEAKAPAITKLWDGTLSPSLRNSPDIATNGYREVIVYFVEGANGGGCGTQWKWRPDASSPYGDMNDNLSFPARGRVAVSGTHVQLQLSGTSCTSSFRFMVAGVL
jgi:hypothetical protein